MRRLMLIATIVMIAGCTRVRSEAFYRPAIGPDGNPVAIYDKDGNVVGIAATKELRQTVSVSAGGKLDEGMLKFSAESIAADGSNWIVTSGAESKGAETPDVTGAVLNFATQAVGGLKDVSIANIEAQKRAAELSAQNAAAANVANTVLKAAGK